MRDAGLGSLCHSLGGKCAAVMQGCGSGPSAQHMGALRNGHQEQAELPIPLWTGCQSLKLCFTDYSYSYKCSVLE